MSDGDGDEITFSELTAARERSLDDLGLTWGELEERIEAGDYTPRERMTWLTYRRVLL